MRLFATMRTIILVLTLTLVAFAGCGASSTAGGGSVAPSGGGGSFNTGDRVTANNRGKGYWFVGLVSAVEPSGNVAIAYLDGEKEVVSPGNVRAFDWNVGTVVACNWKRSGKWFRGKIASLSGDAVHISYDDGDQEDTTLAFCRTGNM